MKRTALIAENDAHWCNTSQHFFTQHRWQVELASNGLECLTRLRQSTPDLLILAFHLPWGGGDGVLALMREDPKLARVPVLLLLTEAPTRGLTELVAPPVVNALVKPQSPSGLFERIMLDWLQGQPKLLKHPLSPGTNGDIVHGRIGNFGSR